MTNDLAGLRAAGVVAMPDLARNGYAPSNWCEAHDCAHECCICDDAGRYRVAGTRELRLCPCRDTNRAPFEATRFGVPERLADATLESWGPGNTRERIVAANYLVRWPPVRPWLTFLGRAGRGKTGLAVGIVRAAYEQYGVGGRLTTAERAIARIYATFDRDNRIETTEDAEQDLMTRPLLVLDDLGANSPNDKAEARLFAILNSRYESMLPTVITANEENDGFQALHPRIKSRLMDTQSGEVLRFSGADRRLNGGER